MPMMRWTPLLLLAGSSPGFAAEINAEQALKRYRDQFQPVAEFACPRDPDSITVCGRRPAGGGLRIPGGREPGEPIHLLPGEPPSAAAALGADRMCVHDCPEPAQGSILNVFKGIGHLLGKDR